MLPARHLAALVVLFVSLIGVLAVSYYQIMDMDMDMNRFLVDEKFCQMGCRIKLAGRCLVCEENHDSKLRIRRAPSIISNNQEHSVVVGDGGEYYEDVAPQHQHQSYQQIIQAESEKRHVHPKFNYKSNPSTTITKSIHQSTDDPEYIQKHDQEYQNVRKSANQSSKCRQMTACLQQCDDTGLINICSGNTARSDNYHQINSEELCEDEGTLVMGHAGGDTVNACENTIEATLLGLEEGMESVHIDISVSKDMVPFLWRDHDPRSLSSRLRQLGMYGSMGCRPTLLPDTLKPAHTLQWKTIQSSWIYMNSTTGLPANHVISFKEWLQELGPRLRSLASIWIEFRMPREYLNVSIRKVWEEALSESVQDKLFFRILDNGKINFHHPITMIGGVDISIDQLSSQQWNSLVFILEEVQTADPNDNVFILNREDEVIYTLLVEKVTSEPSYLSEEIKSLLDPSHLNLNGINFEVKTMSDLVSNVAEVIRSRDDITRDSCQPQYTQVAAWTVNSLDVSNKLFCLHTDFIITDYPGRIERDVQCEDSDKVGGHSHLQDPHDPCPLFCARIYEPVCGSDGVTHSNLCMLRTTECESGLSIKMLHEGRCETESEKSKSIDDSSYSKQSLGNQLSERSVNLLQNDQNVAASYKRSDRKKDSMDLLDKLDDKVLCDSSYCLGNQDYAPVCGEDLLTYDSLCFLKKTRCVGHEVKLKKRGPCNQDSCRNDCSYQINPVCGTDGKSYMNMCTLHQSACLDFQDGEKLHLWHRGECGNCNIICTREFAPVCGSDGVTYPTDCNLQVKSCANKTPVWKVSDGVCDDTRSDEDVNIIFDKDLHNTLHQLLEL